MNPDNLSFGSGSTLLGGSGALAQNMEQGAPVLNQQSPASAGFTPGQQMNPYPPLQTPANPMSILPPTGAPASANMAAAGAPSALPAPKTEHQLIVEALSNRLKHFSDLEKRFLDAHFGGRNGQ